MNVGLPRPCFSVQNIAVNLHLGGVRVCVCHGGCVHGRRGGSRESDLPLMSLDGAAQTASEDDGHHVRLWRTASAAETRPDASPACQSAAPPMHRRASGHHAADPCGRSTARQTRSCARRFSVQPVHRGTYGGVTTSNAVPSLSPITTLRCVTRRTVTIHLE